MRAFLIQSSQVQNQCHAAIPQDGAPGTPRIFLESVTQALDDGFLLANQLVHHQAEALALAFSHDQQPLTGILGTRLDHKLTVEADHREQGSPDRESTRLNSS